MQAQLGRPLVFWRPAGECNPASLCLGHGLRHLLWEPLRHWHAYAHPGRKQSACHLHQGLVLWVLAYNKFKFFFGPRMKKSINRFFYTLNLKLFILHFKTSFLILIIFLFTLMRHKAFRADDTMILYTEIYFILYYAVYGSSYILLFCSQRPLSQ